MGLSDVPNLRPAKLYCARCEDVYNPKSSRHAAIDGAYFGTSFHNIIFQVYPALMPAKSVARYVPRAYGFRVHAAAALVRWQAARRDEMRRRLRRLDVESGFREGEGEDLDGGDGEEDEEGEEEEEEEEDVGDGELVMDDAAAAAAGAGAGAGVGAVAAGAGGGGGGVADLIMKRSGLGDAGTIA